GGGNITMGAVGDNITLRVAPLLIDPESGNPAYLQDTTFRGGMDPFQVNLVSSNPAVGRLFSPIALLGGLRENTTQFRADANGLTDIRVDPPPGFADGGPVLVYRVQITAPHLTIAPIILGKDMQTQTRISVSGPPNMSAPVVPITMTSSDPARVLL